MSTQPEEIEEIEIEEGEIISEDDISEMEDDDDDSMDIAELMTSLLATDEGDTVCSALVNIANQLQTQNKILIKMLSQIKN
jgi:hypothetical protein|tara:strand:- start:19109 stop:19351 length:243 start_codon:yes stop_codon:yes gene_type:complete